MTSEEKKARAKQRTEEKLEKERQFPGADLLQHNYAHAESEQGVLIRLELGNDWLLKVFKHGKWSGSDELGSDYWEEASISLHSITRLAQFIHALICRYNALVDQANGEADQSVMKKLHPISNGQ